MLKLIGAIMICAACTYMGIRKSNELKNREKALKGMHAALGQLETEIGFCANDLKHAFVNICKNSDIHEIFEDAAQRIEKFGIRKAWTYAVMNCRAPFLDADRELLLMLGTRLGMTDTKNQLKHIGYMRELINAQANSAKSEYKRLGNIYRGGGILAGLFIILVIV
ncbi:MAG: stage III sporulation protein AB [Clostridia bacterium]|nr:stage III sporulation protein AB [Clostridia bacterium]